MIIIEVNKCLPSSAASRNKLANKQTNRGADKSLAGPGKKQATATEDFEFHISYL